MYPIPILSPFLLYMLKFATAAIFINILTISMPYSYQLLYTIFWVGISSAWYTHSIKHTHLGKLPMWFTKEYFSLNHGLRKSCFIYSMLWVGISFAWYIHTWKTHLKISLCDLPKNIYLQVSLQCLRMYVWVVGIIIILNLQVWGRGEGWGGDTGLWWWWRVCCWWKTTASPPGLVVYI